MSACSITGPEDVLEALRKQLGRQDRRRDYRRRARTCDVRIVAGQATLETRLEDWMAKLEEATP